MVSNKSKVLLAPVPGRFFRKREAELFANVLIGWPERRGYVIEEMHADGGGKF